MKKFFHNLAVSFKSWLNRRRMARCVREAAKIISRTKLEFPGCEGALCMAWPTTGATGAGNAAGTHLASGTGTTLLWGTANWTNITGWLTVLKISQKVDMAYEEKLPNGDGHTAGLVQGIDSLTWEIEVRDDTQMDVSALQVGKQIVVRDGAGLYPGGARGTTYTGIIMGAGWDTAPRTAAGRTLTVTKFCLF